MAKRVGYSSLMNGVELPKGDFHFEVLGDLDECSAALALARSNNQDEDIKLSLKAIQKDLSLLMGLVAGVSVQEDFFCERLDWIDGLIADLRQTVMMPKGFIVPGETTSEASLDYARAVSRRAERSLTRLAESSKNIDKATLQYLNRVSTAIYLFEIQTRNMAG